jgi:predicted O-methyltransferase YrrM
VEQLLAEEGSITMPVWKKSKAPKELKLTNKPTISETVVPAPRSKGESFLDSQWNVLQPDLSLSGRNDPNGAGAQGFLYPWSHDLSDGQMLAKAMAILKPQVIIELGTFEARGTVVLAEAARYSDSVRLLTFDLGHSPVNSLGPTYGVPYEEKFVSWEGRNDDWASWAGVVAKRTERFNQIRSDYQNIQLEFIEGFTYDTLPRVLGEAVERWDFCFQDTLHDLDNILLEWVLLKPFSRVGSVMVMDDMVREGAGPPVVEYFRLQEPDWGIRHSTTGRQQLWIERIK